MYYRRWTRMYLMPALKYYTKYGVIDQAYNIYKPIFNNIQNPIYFEPKRGKLPRSARQKDLDTKLIQKLFLKYPDLKYESIGRSQYKGDRLTSFSYAHSFLNEQKKLIREGYSPDAAFELVEKKFHQKFQRKLDQSLLARGLAIGNRARSFLTVYQQQVEYESRLKTMRTKREVQKYKDKLQKVKQRVESEEVTDKAHQEEHYTRMFMKLTENPNKAKEQDIGELDKEKRAQKIQEVEQNFKNMFSQFYQRAAYKDKLSGLTDQEIKKEIMTSPQKIKNQTRQLIEYLRNKVGVYLNENGDLSFTDPKIDPRLKEYLLSSPKVKIAMLNQELGYEKPAYGKINRYGNMDKRRILTTEEPRRLSREENDLLRNKKRQQFEQIIDDKIPIDRRSYRIFETEEERMIRLQLKYLNKVIGKASEGLQEKLPNLDINAVIEKFRRLKFRVQKRYRQSAKQQLLFSEHSQFKDLIDIEDEVQFQSLIQYLKKKASQRRLTSIDQSLDNTINQLINPQLIPQVAGVSNIDKDEYSVQYKTEQKTTIGLMELEGDQLISVQQNQGQQEDQQTAQKRSWKRKPEQKHREQIE